MTSQNSQISNISINSINSINSQNLQISQNSQISINSNVLENSQISQNSQNSQKYPYRKYSIVQIMNNKTSSENENYLKFLYSIRQRLIEEDEKFIVFLNSYKDTMTKDEILKYDRYAILNGIKENTDFLVDNLYLYNFLGKGARGNVYHVKSFFNPNFNMIIKTNSDIDSGFLESQILQVLEKNFEKLNLKIPFPFPNYFTSFYDEKNDIYNIMMKYINGFSDMGKLEETLSEEKTDEELLFIGKIISNLVNTLNILHNLGVVHLDIKPYNILYDSNGNVKFIDFENSEYSRRVFESKNSVNIEDIQKGSYFENINVGTSCFTAPDFYDRIINDEVVSFYECVKADYWSLGMTIICILTKKDIFDILLFENDDTFSFQKFMEHENQFNMKIHSLLPLFDRINTLSNINFNILDLINIDKNHRRLSI